MDKMIVIQNKIKQIDLSSSNLFKISLVELKIMGILGVINECSHKGHTTIPLMVIGTQLFSSPISAFYS